MSLSRILPRWPLLRLVITPMRTRTVALLSPFASMSLRRTFLLAGLLIRTQTTRWGTFALLSTNQLLLTGGKILVDEPHSSLLQFFAVPGAGGRGEDDEEKALDVSLDAFQARNRQDQSQKQTSKRPKDEEFDGYALRDVIYEKWQLCYDVDFSRVDSFGFRCLYLNILPFHLGGRRFRHESEMDYLCHLQAVVEILQKYNQVCQFKRRCWLGLRSLISPYPISLIMCVCRLTKHKRNQELGRAL
jgi:hypothetical protein